VADLDRISTRSDKSLLAKVRELVVPAMETQGRIEAWIVDDRAS
jgi:hypothetical protein